MVFKLINIIGFGKCNPKVEVVDRNRCNLSNIPEEAVRSGRTLREIYLDENRIQDLPKCFFKLNQLEKVSLESNEIGRLPTEVGNLTELLELNLSRNDIQEIPDTISHCSKMEILDLSHNNINFLPDSLCFLQNLSKLSLNCANLFHLPRSLGNMRSLSQLELRENMLKNLPDSICELKELMHIDLEDNRLTHLPDDFGALSGLKELILDKNEIGALPPSFGHLRSLTWVDLCSNLIEELPENLDQLVNLELFNLSKNFLEKIPDSIGLLKKLQILKVDQNKLLELSTKINGCEQLTELVLTENLLSQIPDELTELKNLTNLAVDRNRLSELPESIGLCTKLRMLHLRENNLTLLPESLANCTSLTVLDVAENNLLFLPARMQELQLKAIWLSENQNQPLVKFHEETISFQGEERDVLLCYMLPQKKKTQEVILRRSIIESDDGTFAAGVLRRTETRASVTFDTEPPKNDSEDESQFTLYRHKTPHPATLRELDEKAKRVVDNLANAQKKESKTLASMMKDHDSTRTGPISKKERHGEWLDLQCSIDEDDETQPDGDESENKSHISEATVNLSIEQVFENEAATTADTVNGTVCTKPDDDFIATSIVVPSDLIDIKIEREAPKCPIVARLSVRELEEATEEIKKDIEKDHQAKSQDFEKDHLSEDKTINGNYLNDPDPIVERTDELNIVIEQCQENLGHMLTQMEMSVTKDCSDRSEDTSKKLSLTSLSSPSGLQSFGFSSYRSSMINSASFYDSSASSVSDDEDDKFLYISDDDFAFDPSSSKPSEISDNAFFGSTENELTCAEKSDTELFDNSDESDFDAKLIMLASIMAEQCIIESKKLVSVKGKLKNTVGSTGTLDSNTSGSTVDLGDDFEEIAFNIVAHAIVQAKVEVTERLQSRPVCKYRSGPRPRDRGGPPCYTHKNIDSSSFGTLWNHGTVSDKYDPLPHNPEINNFANNLVLEIIQDALDEVLRSQPPKNISIQNDFEIEEYKTIATSIVMNAIDTAKLKLSYSL